MVLKWADASVVDAVTAEVVVSATQILLLCSLILPSVDLPVLLI